MTEFSKDCCAWRGCGDDTKIVFLGAGLCDQHWSQACAVYKDTTDYLLERVTAEAASEIRARRAKNQAQRN